MSAPVASRRDPAQPAATPPAGEGVPQGFEWRRQLEFARRCLRTLNPGKGRRPRPGRSSRLRARFLLSFLILGYGALTYRLYQVQLVEHETWTDRARAQQVRTRAVTPERGRILMRDGDRLVPVAISVRRGSLMIEGRKDRDVPKFMEALAKAVGDLSEDERVDVERRLTAGRAFFFRRHELLPEQVERIQAARLPRAHVEIEPRRAYPFGPLSAQVLGLVTAEHTGGSGLEARLDAYLQGTAGEQEVKIDRRRRELVGLGEQTRPAVAGADVILSIDRSAQQIAREELARLAEEHEPEGAAIVVVDPRTGDVVAIASWPTFDPRDPGKDFRAGQHNRAISHGYEPGSTMKPLLVGMAWQLGLGHPERMINCPRRLRVPGRRKPIVDSHTVGLVEELQVLIQSSNSGAYLISSRLSFEQVRRTITSFGLGRRAGVGLPAEIAGDTRSLRKMNKAHLAAVAQGYAVMVTPLQMAMAYAALANGGTLLRPRLVQEIRSRRGNVIRRFEPRAAARPLQGPVSRGALRQALVEVVNSKRGTARRARSKRYTIAGKTGTTKKLENGRYHEREVVASFCGFAPAENPRLAFAVVAWAPSTKKRRAWGGTVAAPCAGRAAERILTLMRVPASPRPQEETRAK